MRFFQRALPRSWGFMHEAPAQVLISQGSLSTLTASLKASQRRQPRALLSTPPNLFPPSPKLLASNRSKTFHPSSLYFP